MSYLTGKVHVGHDPKRDVEIWAPRIVWGDKYVETTATEAMRAATSSGYTAQSQLKEAIAFLEKMLADGPVLQREVKQAAEAHDIATSTLKRARQRLKVGNKIVNGPKGNEYYWEMPPAPPTKINKQVH